MYNPGTLIQSLNYCYLRINYTQNNASTNILGSILLGLRDLFSPWVTKAQWCTLIRVAWWWRRRRPFSIGVSGPRHVVHRGPRHGERGDTRSLEWVTIPGGWLRHRRSTSDGTAVSCVVRGWGGWEGASLIRVEAVASQSLSHNAGWGRRGRGDGTRSPVLIWGGAIRASAVLLIIVDHTAAFTLVCRRCTLWVWGASRGHGWWWRWGTRGIAEATPRITRGLRPVTRETGWPVFTVWWAVVFLLASWSTLWNLHMNSFSCKCDNSSY